MFPDLSKLLSWVNCFYSQLKWCPKLLNKPQIVNNQNYCYKNSTQPFHLRRFHSRVLWVYWAAPWRCTVSRHEEALHSITGYEDSRSVSSNWNDSKKITGKWYIFPTEQRITCWPHTHTPKPCASVWSLAVTKSFGPPALTHACTTHCVPALWLIQPFHGNLEWLNAVISSLVLWDPITVRFKAVPTCFWSVLMLKTRWSYLWGILYSNTANPLHVGM